jgi:heterodisulfide reductase subunit C
MVSSYSLDISQFNFQRKIEQLSGERIFNCYQCGMCSAGCPFANEMDMLPSQVIRRIQLDDIDVLESNAMWVCASCLACEVRCPKGVDLAKLMEAMRQMYLRNAVDQLEIDHLEKSDIRRLPQIALVASFRKKTG